MSTKYMRLSRRIQETLPRRSLFVPKERKERRLRTVSCATPGANVFAYVG